MANRYIHIITARNCNSESLKHELSKLVKKCSKELGAKISLFDLETMCKGLGLSEDTVAMHALHAAARRDGIVITLGFFRSKIQVQRGIEFGALETENSVALFPDLQSCESDRELVHIFEPRIGRYPIPGGEQAISMIRDYIGFAHSACTVNHGGQGIQSVTETRVTFRAEPCLALAG